MQERFFPLPMQCRVASVQPASLNEEKRTVDLIWTTGARVMRYDFWTDTRYEESLSLDVQHINMVRLNSGAPVLNTHGAKELSQVIGVVERAWIEGNEGKATVRFSDRQEVAGIWGDVKSGVIRNVSVGYAVRKYEILKEEGKLPHYRAIDWEPMELSLVPIGADAGAGVRSQTDIYPCMLINDRAQAPEEKSMGETTQKAAGEESVNVDAVRAEAVANERNRAKEIREAVHLAKLDDKVAEDLIEKGMGIDEARKQVLSRLAEQSDANPTRSQVDIYTVSDETENRRAAVESALLHRYDAQRNKLTEPAREYWGLSLLEIGRDLLEKRGVRTRGLSRMEIATRAMHSTSDFPFILANVATKTLRAAYQAAPQTFKPFSRTTTAADFKQMTRVQLGDAPDLEKVNEGGEFKRGTIGEAKEAYAIATFGKIVSITRQTIINDDLNAFSRLAELFGRAAADLESDTVWGIITANGAMNDTIAIFHANHSNLDGTPAAISIASLGVARSGLRKQKGLNGRFINGSARYLLVPTTLETIAQQFTVQTNIVYTKGSDFNPFAGSLQVIAEPRLDANSTTAWYLVTDPTQIDTIEYAYLEGEQGVYLESRQGFDVDGIDLKVRLDFGAKAIDHRGMWKNAGA